MKLRLKYWTRTIFEYVPCLLLSIAIFTTISFQLTVVIPSFHDFGSLPHLFSLLIGAFLVFNINGNMLAIMMVDTSIRHKIIKCPQTDDDKWWRLCVVCECIAPPRSWHCNICKTCILKKDHHCILIGCCIGHRNHRYFLIFLFYFLLGTIYTTVYNSLYLWVLKNDEFFNKITIIKMICPILMLTIDSSSKNLCIFIYELNVIGLVYSLVLLIYHGNIILKGAVIQEMKEKLYYDLGWKENLKMVLGVRWFLVWLSPLIQSKLPHNGINWEIIRTRTNKNK